MSTEPLFSLRNRWFTTSAAAMVVVFVVSFVIGFIWLPSVQRDAQFQGVWNAICSAAGLPRNWFAGDEAPVQPAKTLSTVALSPYTLAPPTPQSIGRGATLAMQCTMCHGERGMSQANTPNLAGQYPSVVYKQLLDFKTGARVNAVMSPMVVNLSDQDMRDLAAYYAYLPRPSTARVREDVPVPDIVATGAPMRNIAPCASCHGGIDKKVGSPWLNGMPAAYIKAQLQAFAAGARYNDISGQMRNVARNMTPDEIEAAASYYAASAK
ncbi:c-type cytochrome [Pararobbsia silviterrae]|uniref:Cytochrome c4 n=1 Tax=Pararobbsia silviterrae TaxID=1792498 RepID=A0A494Y593_9BURK|nr:c-type cytochrome [Pararobbsia silviterrae]RKP55741.1 cytochrome c4 [Pararobbsia silviterrae]